MYYLDYLSNNKYLFEELKFSPLPRHSGLQLINEFCIRKTNTIYEINFKKLQSIIQSFIDHPNDDVVSISNFTYRNMDDFERYEYSYEMQRLYNLNDEEKFIVDSSYDNLGEEWEDTVFIIKAAKEHSPKLYNFLYRALYHLKYKDMHSGNVMKDNVGNYKIIDIEGFIGL